MVVVKEYDYEAFKHDTKFLIQKTEDFEPQAIVGIARGGLTLAHAMAEGLKVREVQTLRTELYDGSVKRSELRIFDSCELQHLQRILVVDDIADSGETLFAIMKHLQEKYKEIEFKSATLFYKKTSVYEPHFWINEADEWIDFFWERDFKV